MGALYETAPAASGQSDKQERLLCLDRCMPSWDAARVERRVIDASSQVLFQVALNTDFVEAATDGFWVRTLFGLRGAAQRSIAILRRRPRARPSRRELFLGSLPLRGEWVTLGQRWRREIAFGAIGRFRAGETTFLKTDASVFRRFRTPGFGKIGCHLTFRPLGDGRTLVTYECRAKATDPASRRAFLRYWAVLSPFVGIVMRAMLAGIERGSTSIIAALPQESRLPRSQ